MNKITIVNKTGQVSTYKMAFMSFEDVVAKGKEYITSASVVEIVVENSVGDVVHIEKKGNTIVTTYDYWEV